MLFRSLRLTILFAAVGMAGAGYASAEDGDDEYPIEIIARPFTLPQGAVQFGVAAEADKSFDTVYSGVQVDYGLIRRLQVGAGYALPLKEFDVKGDAYAEANFLFLTGGKLEGMATVTSGYSLGGEAALPLDAGVLFWYTISDMMAVYTVPTLSMALADQVDDAGNAVKPIYVSIPVALAVQPIQTVYLEVGTEIATINVSDSATAIFGADYVPIYMEGYFSPSNKLDFGVGVSWADVVDDAGALSLLAVVRARGGI